MYYTTPLLGSSAVQQLHRNATTPVLTIGKDRFTRGQLASVSCFNFIAARWLEAVLRDLEVRDLKDVYDRIPPQALALPRVGAITLSVLGAAFEAKGIGGESPLESYAIKHADTTKNGQPKQTTFDTMKRHVQAHEADTSTRTRSRRRRSPRR